jgi:hypothetical protein
MGNAICPHLGTMDEQNVRGPNVEYPSFENRCLAINERGLGDAGTVILTDQATFCLASGHTYCPRYRAALGAGDEQTDAGSIGTEPIAEPLASDWLSANLGELDQGIAELADDSAAERRMWGWMGAGLLFLMVFLCSSAFAVYLGWQTVSSTIRASQGQLRDSVSVGPNQAPEAPLLIVITATSETEVQETAPVGAVLIAPPTPTFDFPVAVTPTPALVAQTGPAVGSVTGGTGAGSVTQASAPTPVVVAPPTPAPLIDVNVPVPEAPTRRPTPTFEIVEIVEENTPTTTPSPTATYGPPIVIFKAKESIIEPGECTEVFWNVRNVKEVYYEGLGVPGEGSKEECIDEDGDVLYLLVVLPNGITEEYTVTITPLLPTPTHTPTVTFTPIPQFTPTWTPQPPPTTPTRVVTYGVDLGVIGGSRQQCAVGATCSIGLSTSNLGNEPDDLAVEIVEAGPWSSQICRTDGVCAANTITLYNVGPGNSGTVNLSLSIPADAGSQTATYSVRASSGKTGQAVRSDLILVEIQIQ